jgi:hypothetical protein
LLLPFPSLLSSSSLFPLHFFSGFGRSSKQRCATDVVLTIPSAWLRGIIRKPDECCMTAMRHAAGATPGCLESLFRSLSNFPLGLPVSTTLRLGALNAW